MTTAHILVVDDEPDIRDTVKDILEDEGYSVATAADGDSTRRQLAAQRPDLILLDIWMPGTDGITLLKQLKENMESPIPVVMISGHGTIETAVEATKLGAVDFIEKPLSLARLLATVKSALRVSAKAGRDTFSRAMAQRHQAIGHSTALQAIRQRIEMAAQHDRPILLRGELGSGKMFWARYLLAHSARRDHAFVSVDGLWLSQQNEAERLFGKGGFWEQAQGGLLYMSDPLELQSATLDALAANQGSTDLNTPRLVFGLTPESLRQVDRREQHQKLFHQIGPVTLEIPPLRERSEDVPELLTYFLNRLAQAEMLEYRPFTVAAQNRLRYYSWPGNLREMKSLVRNLLLGGNRDDIDVTEVEHALASTAYTPNGREFSRYFNVPLREARDVFEREYLLFHLREQAWNVGEVAHASGMERTHLYRKIRSLGIDIRHEKK